METSGNSDTTAAEKASAKADSGSAKSGKSPKSGGYAINGGSGKSGRSSSQHIMPRQWVLFLILLIVFSLIAYLAYGYITTKRISLPGQSTDEITIGTTMAPANFNLAASTDDATSQALQDNVYQSLLKRDPNQNVPASASPLLDSWSLSPDGLTYTFHLKDEIYFSNGSKLTASDVVWSLKTGIQRNEAAYAPLRAAKSVENQGERTVIIRLSSPLPQLAWLLCGRLGVVYSQAAGGPQDASAVGTGPYTVSKLSPAKAGAKSQGGESAPASLKLTARRDHQYASFRGSNVTFRYYSDPEQAWKDVQAATIDAYLPAQPTSQKTFSQAKSSMNLTVDTSGSSRRVGLAFNSSADSVFSEQRFREAYRYFLDQNALISATGLHAHALTGPIPSVEPGFQDFTSQYHKDVQAGQKLLSYFGYRPRLFLCPKSLEKIGRAVNAQLAAAGEHLNLTVVDDAAFTKQVLQDKKYDLAIVPFSGSHDMDDLTNPDGFLNFTDSVTDQNRAALGLSRNDSQYQSNLQKTAARLTDQAAVAWLFEEDALVIHQNSLTSIRTTSPSSYLPLADGLQKK